MKKKRQAERRRKPGWHLLTSECDADTWKAVTLYCYTHGDMSKSAFIRMCIVEFFKS
jgi:hypothetical protein